MIINIKPIDVLFFRDSKPFSRGSDHFAKSIFPPYPQTLYGAFRTKALEELQCDFGEFKEGNLIFKNEQLVNANGGIDNIKEQIGDVNSIGKFLLKGPVLLKQNKSIYIKIPADVKKVSGIVKIMSPFDWNQYGIETDFNLNNYPHLPTNTPAEDLDGYISLRAFINFYLLNEQVISEKDILKPNDIFEYEIRTGIEINDEKDTTQEGKLYTAGFVRLKDEWSLYAEIENLSVLPQNGTLKLGGSNRVCECTTLNNNPFGDYFQDAKPNIMQQIQETKKFKIVLLTPTIFNNGWISDKFNSNFELEKNNVKIKLISAVINKPEYISGWDIAKRRPKPLKKLVPAGSVYYFELVAGTVEDLFTEFNFKNFTDENPNLGFGLTLIGGI
jgi:CRISPR-associated protein Cmr3